MRKFHAKGKSGYGRIRISYSGFFVCPGVFWNNFIYYFLKFCKGILYSLLTYDKIGGSGAHLLYLGMIRKDRKT